MRIISDFHDYYDSCQTLGQDRTLIYRRFERELIEEGKHGHLSYPWFCKGHLYYRTIDVGFCGKLFTVIMVGYNEDHDPAFSFCYSIADIDAHVHKHHSSQEYDSYLTVNSRTKRPKWNPDHGRQAFEKRFVRAREGTENLLRLFESGGCPIFTVEHLENRVITTFNARLKNIEFFRVFDPYAAFQEIAMYLGNIAQPRKPIPAISDEVMAEIKGFDKWSFRKPPRT